MNLKIPVEGNALQVLNGLTRELQASPLAGAINDTAKSPGCPLGGEKRAETGAQPEDNNRP